MANSRFILDAYKGLGTAFWIELFLLDSEKETIEFATIQTQLEKTISDFEKKYSRFREDSLLNELNSKKQIPFDYDLASMVTQAKKVHDTTSGVFSIFIKEALEEKGYGKKITPHNEIHTSEEASDVIVDENTITLKGAKGIDLGGIGKGYLVDKLATILQDTYNVRYFLINAGGDIYVTSNHGEPVRLFLEHPTHPDEYIATIEVKNRAFCSSSSFKRKWNKDGTVVNHFIAERDVWAASYLVGENTTTTDMFATVFCIIANENEMLERFSKHEHIEYVVINDVGKMLVSKAFPWVSD